MYYPSKNMHLSDTEKMESHRKEIIAYILDIGIRLDIDEDPDYLSPAQEVQDNMIAFIKKADPHNLYTIDIDEDIHQNSYGTLELIFKDNNKNMVSVEIGKTRCSVISKVNKKNVINRDIPPDQVNIVFDYHFLRLMMNG